MKKFLTTMRVILGITLALALILGLSDKAAQKRGLD